MHSFLSKFYGDDATVAAEKAAADKAAADKAAADKAAADAAANKLFTQDEVNRILAEHKRTLQDKVAELGKQTSDLPKYQQKVKELQESLMTKEELAKQEAERRKAEYDEAVKVAQADKEHWQKKYLQNTFDVEFARAAGKQEVFDADQFALILKDKCQTVEITDDTGKGTGRYKVMMQVEENGKTLTLSCEDGLAKLREMGKYPNQFRTNKVPGTGGSNFAGDHKTGGNGVPQSFQDFQALSRRMKAAGTL